MVCKLTHANTKVDVFVAVPLIFSCYYSEATKCTHVLASGGAIIPVIESPDAVMKEVTKHREGLNEVQGKTKRAK